jgi:hypothetical protein
MSIYVESFVRAAFSDQDWGRAYRDYKKSWEEIRRLHSELKDSSAKDTES